MNKLALIIVFVLSFVSTAFADVTLKMKELVNDLTVKTFSSKDTKGIIKQGSGVIINKGDDTYILTSEHTVFHHENANHSVVLSDKSIVPARFIGADWSRGMALLQVDKRLSGTELSTVKSVKTNSELIVAV